MRKAITVNGTTHSYIEQNPSGIKTIFFIHGNSCSSRMWQKQFESNLFKNYRLIAIDLPGHGESPRSNKPLEEYSPVVTAKILSEAIKNLSDKNAYVFVGSSYGSNLTVEMLSFGLKPLGAVLAGSCVFGENYGLDKIFIQNKTPSIYLYNEPNKQVISDYLHNSLLSASKEDLHNSIEDYLKVDHEFKPALFKTVSEGKISDEIKILNQQDIPVCVVFGEKDNVVNIDYLDSTPFPVWRNQIFKLEDAGHWMNMDQPDRFNQILSDYLTDVFKANHV